MNYLFRANLYQQWHYPRPGIDPRSRHEGERLPTACGRSLVPLHGVTFDATAIHQMTIRREICGQCTTRRSVKEDGK